jgi:hypothetical protein
MSDPAGDPPSNSALRVDPGAFRVVRMAAMPLAAGGVMLRPSFVDLRISVICRRPQPPIRGMARVPSTDQHPG